MLRDGHYDVTFATLMGEGSVRLRFAGGVVTGLTDRGTAIEGTAQFDAARNVIRFALVAVVPPHKTSITGLATGDAPRRVSFKGETPVGTASPRFSIDFAGRAVDIVARYSGPL